MAIRNTITSSMTETLKSSLKKVLGNTKEVKAVIKNLDDNVKSAQEDAARFALQSGVPLTFSKSTFPEVVRDLGFQHVPGLNYLHPTQLRDLPRAKVLRALENNIEIMADAFNDPAFLSLLESGKFVDPEEALAFYWNARSDLQRAGGGILSPRTLAGGSAVLSPRANPVEEVGEFSQILTDPAGAYTGKVTYGNVDKSVDIVARQPDWTTGSGRNLIKKAPSRKALEDDFHWDTKAFNYAQNQQNPSNPRGLTADTHALAIALGLPQFGQLGPDVFGDRAIYDLVRTAYINVAGRRGLLPQELQALTWSPWRQLMNNDTSVRPMLGNITLHPTVIQAASGDPLPFLMEAKSGARAAKNRRIAKGDASEAAADKSYQSTLASLRATAEKAGIDPSRIGGYSTPEVAALLALAGGGLGAGAYGLSQMQERPAPGNQLQMDILAMMGQR